ncbi:MAG: hypothetical protein AAFR61_15060 [Bacteroidota bacterium]
MGYSGRQLEKTLYRHFQDWQNSPQYRATYYDKGSYEIMVIIHRSCYMAFTIEQFYQHKLKPRDGVRQLEIPLEEIDFSYMPNPPKIEPEVAPF